MLRAVALAALAASAAATTYFEERFQDDDWKGRWVESQWKSEMGKWVRGLRRRSTGRCA